VGRADPRSASVSRAGGDRRASGILEDEVGTGTPGDLHPEQGDAKDALAFGGGGDLEGRSAKGYLALLENEDLVGNLESLIEVVDDEADRDPFPGKGTGDAENSSLVGEVEVVRRFVEKEVAGFAVVGGIELGEDAGEVDALFFASGKGGVGIPLPLMEIDLAEGPAGGGVVVRALAAAHVGTASEEDDLKNGKGKIEGGFLVEVGPQLAEAADGHGVERLALDEDLSPGGIPFPGKDAQEGGLASAVWPEDCGDAAGFELEADFPENVPPAEVEA